MTLKNFAAAVAIAALAPCGLAVTSISDSKMTALLNAGGAQLAYNYAPIWFFGQAMNQPPCIPDWAFGGSPTKKDTYTKSSLTKPVPRCDYPDVGCQCRQPGIGIGNPSPAFPVYYSYEKCNATEVRVAYNLFYQKDGFIIDGFDVGHNWDWERVIIIHSQDSKTKNWAPSEALYSSHSGYNSYKWGDIQNTLTTQQAEAGDAINPNGVKNQDHPKVYVAWAKHPNFDDRNTACNFWGCQVGGPLSGEAFRSQDWWYFVAQNYFLRCDPSTDCGKVMLTIDWGEADSDPPKVHQSLCTQGN